MARGGPPIVDLEDVVESVNMVLYGNPGVGKTVQAGTLPNNLILSTDTSGTVSAKRQGSKAKLWQIDSWDDLQAAYDYLRKGQHDFEWVTIDTGTRMQDLCIRGILGKAVEENSSRSLDIPAIQDHQAWQNRFKRFVDLFVALPINTLFVFHVMTIEDEEGEEIRLPQLQGGKSWVAIARSMPARFSVVGLMEEKVVAKIVGEGDDAVKKPTRIRRIHWQNGKTWMAKDRYDCLGKYTDDVPLNEIVEKILGEGQIPKAVKEPLKVFPSQAGRAPRKTAAKAAARKAVAKYVPDDEEDDE